MLTKKEEILSFQTLWQEAGAPALTDNEQNTLLQGAVKTAYPKGTHVHAPDAPCRGMLLVLSGRLRVYLLSDEGREVTLYRVGPGELCILSASCVLSAITFPVFIDAEQDTELYQVGSAALKSLTDTNIYLRSYSYEMAVRRFSDALWAMQEILFRGVDKRLAAYLLREAEHQNSTTLTLSQEKIAADIGTSREVVSRMLRLFHEEGLTDNTRGRVTILDAGKLQERAGK